MMSAPQPGWCRRRRAATAESDGAQCKGYTSRAERSAGFAKTRLCKFFQEGKCTRGKKCTFAHGEEDKEDQSQPVCMKLCKTLIATGRCKNPSCKYAHSKDDIIAAKQLTAGLVDSQAQSSIAEAMPVECGQPAGQGVQLSGNNLATHGNVRWFGFLYSMRWVCPQRASRVVVPPPGVLEPPGASSAGVSYPAMQMQPAQPPAHQLEENSLSISPEPAFQVVVKNTFIDVVEASPRSIHRSRSEPPRFMNRDVEKRPRCQTAAEDVAVSFAEQQGQESNCLPEASLASATEMEPSEVSHCTQEISISLSSALRLASVEVSQLQHFTQEDMIEDGVNSAMETKTCRRGESVAFSDMAVPTFEVRNTFIEVCESSPKAQSLRPVRSDADLLALEREAI